MINHRTDELVYAFLDCVTKFRCGLLVLKLELVSGVLQEVTLQTGDPPSCSRLSALHGRYPRRASDNLNLLNIVNIVSEAIKDYR